MIYPSDFESKIGFDYLRACVSENCQSSMGKAEVAKMTFSSDFSFIKTELGCVEEMMRIISANQPLPLDNIHDIVPYLVEIRADGSYMVSDRLYRLMRMLRMMSDLSVFFKSSIDSESGVTPYPCLVNAFADIALFPLIVSEIERCVNKFGEVKDSASPALSEIRSQIRSASGSMQRAMRRVIDRAVANGIVEKDASPSIRDGRMVIPVTAANKRGIQGIIHDESATGKTVFIEPAEVVEAGNRLRELEMEERREIIAILRGIADFVRPHIDDIIEACRSIGRLDFIRAKAIFAIDLDAQLPHIEDKHEIEWYHAVHPGLVMALRPQSRAVVPLNLNLTEDRRILIISGPNAGGKSVCLKTTAVVQYMMQCGLMPTVYNNSHMGIFKNIFIDIGDEQSFENDLSTYSSHLKNMKYFINHTDERSLILADEMGSGTEPQIGGALAQAILQKLGKSGCMGIVTTHYQNLKTFADSESGFVNGAMLYDRQHLQPTFELSVGNPGSSFALDIATKIGLPRDVIEEAKEIVGSDYVNLDKYLSEIARDRRYWANKRQNIREKESKLDSLLSNYEETAGDLRAQRKAIINDARKEAREILEGVNAKIERTILEIRKAEAEKEKTKALRRELDELKKNVIEDADSSVVDKLPKALAPLRHKSRRVNENARIAGNDTIKGKTAVKDLQPGDYVKMIDGSMTGKVLSVNGKKAEVAFGSLRTIVDTVKLRLTSKPKESALSSSMTISSATSEESRKRQLNFKNEIDVRGMRADEALQAVTYFIDDAIQFSAAKVRILHGTGHGILKTLIREQLRANGAVRHFEDEDVRFGGAGITVVDLE